MRRARITYPGAYHHIMNRGYEGNPIFSGHQSKSRFLDYLEDSSKKMKIRLLAYCVMDNHYHLVLENASGRMSDFLKLLNGQYGMYYRKKAGGIGYVFQSRFKSTLIENDAYLVQSILYLLRNPVRARIVQLPEDYIWSSAAYYFSDKTASIIDHAFVEELFNSKEEFLSALHQPAAKDLPVVITKYGEVMGGADFLESALKKFDRRKKPTFQSRGAHRQDEQYFDPVEKVIWEFERAKSIDIDDIDTRTLEGKRLRAEFLVRLKEVAGLKYREIAEFDMFGDLGLSGLRAIYQNYRNK